MILENVRLGNTDIFVSRAGFGVLPMGPSQLALPVKKGAEILVYAMDHGIRFIDTAQYYRTYPYIREALKMIQARQQEETGSRIYDDIVICSKCLYEDYDSMMKPSTRPAPSWIGTTSISF